jgi:hypothetical protein
MIYIIDNRVGVSSEGSLSGRVNDGDECVNPTELKEPHNLSGYLRNLELLSAPVVGRAWTSQSSGPWCSASQLLRNVLSRCVMILRVALSEDK